MLPVIKFSRSDFPTDWNDDIRMNFLFSPFRERSVNPEGYDAKLNFWIRTIYDLCLKSQTPIINNTALCLAFERKGQQPLCLDIVLKDMIRRGLITEMDEYAKVYEEKGWLGWSFDLLVQKPVFWGFESFYNLWNSTKAEENFVVLNVARVLSSKILNRYHELLDTTWTDNAVFLTHLKQECYDICLETDFALAILQLQKDKEASIFEEKGEKVIKFKKLDETKIEPLSEVDKGVLSLKRARDTIMYDMDSLETNIASCEDAAKQFVKKGLKSKAMLSLKNKKRLEAILKKKSIAYDNIENLLCQLKNAGTEKMVLAAYQTGVQAMKRTTSGELDLDNIDVVMSDVQEVLDDYNEVQSTLSKSVTGDDGLEEFEEELENLMAGKESVEKSPVKDRPKKDMESDEYLKELLKALRPPPANISPVKKKVLQKPLKAP